MVAHSLTARLVKVFFRAWLPIAIIGAWEFFTRFFPNPFIPSPSKIYERGEELLSLAWLAENLLPTLTVVGTGLFLGATIGFLGGVTIGSSRVLNSFLTPLVVLVRSTPSAAKIPVVMAILGIGTATIVTAVTIAVAFQMMLVVIRATEVTEEKYMDAIRLNALSWYQSTIWIRVPAATGELLSGMYLSLQIATLVTIVSEILGSSQGIGVFILSSMAQFRVTDMWVGIMVIGVTGLLLHEILRVIEQRIFRRYYQSKGHLE